MKNFLFVYRSEPNSNQPSPEEMQANMKRWMDWIGNIVAQDKLVDRGNGLQAAGKVVKQNTVVTYGPTQKQKKLLVIPYNVRYFVYYMLKKLNAI